LYKIISIVVLLVFAGNSKSQEIRKIKITDLATYIERTDHPMIVNFWATYCVPCMEEMPALINITEMYKRDGVELLLVSLDMPKSFPDKISKFAKERGLPAGILWLEETNADYFCPKVDTQWSGAIPATLFINHKTGYRKFFEQQLSAAQIQNLFSEMLDPTKKGKNSTALDAASN
jgi:thiol-disulfide isomerase/thioredoxin